MITIKRSGLNDYAILDLIEFASGVTDDIANCTIVSNKMIATNSKTIYKLHINPYFTIAKMPSQQQHYVGATLFYSS